MNINDAKLTKKETIALLIASICGSISNENTIKYIFISRGKRSKSNWVDTILSSLSTKIDGLTPHFDRNGQIVPGSFWVSREISDWADAFDRDSVPYQEFHKMCTN